MKNLTQAELWTSLIYGVSRLVWFQFVYQMTPLLSHYEKSAAAPAPSVFPLLIGQIQSHAAPIFHDMRQQSVIMK